MRDWCVATGYPLPDLIGRGRAVREAGLLTQGGHGVNAPAAIPQDGAVLLLSTIVSKTWKDAPKEVRRYGSLPLINTTGDDEFTRAEFDPDPLPFPNGTSLLDALTQLLERCGIRREFRLLALKVKRSEVFPTATLSFATPNITPTGKTYTKAYYLTFSVAEGRGPELIEISFQLNHTALNTMADLLAPNVAAANRARMQAKHETGPSVSADEPIPFDNLPRAATPATQGTHLEANDKEKESQVGFESCGRSSGGSSLPPTESCDDRDDRPDRPSPCAA